MIEDTTESTKIEINLLDLSDDFDDQDITQRAKYEFKHSYLKVRRINMAFFMIFISMNGLLVGYGSIMDKFVRHWLINNVCQIEVS